MTREDALLLLNANETTPLSEIESKYKEFYSDNHLRLTNAPSPPLKKLYQQKLRELEEARSILLSNTDIDTGDLVSPDPVLEKGTGNRREEKPDTQTVINKKKKETEKPKTGNSKMLIILLIISIVVGLSGCIVLFEMYSRSNKINIENADKLAQFDDLIKVKEKYDRLTKNFKMVIVNKFNKPVAIKNLISYYFDSEGEVQIFQSSQNFSHSIAPGEEYHPEMTSNKGIDWHGLTFFYFYEVESETTNYNSMGFYETKAINGKLIIGLK